MEGVTNLVVYVFECFPLVCVLVYQALPTESFTVIMHQIVHMFQLGVKMYAFHTEFSESV